jgi:hypothetical protein
LHRGQVISLIAGNSRKKVGAFSCSNVTDYSGRHVIGGDEKELAQKEATAEPSVIRHLSYPHRRTGRTGIVRLWVLKSNYSPGFGGKCDSGSNIQHLRQSLEVSHLGDFSACFLRAGLSIIAATWPSSSGSG